MTEQPVETEQEFLGNASHVAPRIIQPAFIGAMDAGAIEFTPLPEIPLQHYAPGAHRLAPAWAPGDDVELSALVRKSINANKLLAIAKAESVKAETALQLALGVEDEATTAAHEAELDLRDFTRRGTGL
jgi:hypothetical protein